jgi:hypothetical protein
MNDLFEPEVSQPIVDKKKGTYETGKGYISYSQYKQYMKCPASWKFDKIDKLGKFEGSVSTIFGTAIHEALQDYLTIYFEQGSIAVENFDYLDRFKSVFLSEFKKETERGVVITLDECREHIQDGIDILKHVLSQKVRNDHFNRNEYELVGIEIELDEEIANNVKIKGFIDLVLKEKDTGKIKIFDIKTSTNGWNKYQKEDLLLLDQVLLYKKFYSDKFKVKLSDIEVQFFILKRKLYENVDFPQTKLQIVRPLSGKKTVEESYSRLKEFVEYAFDSNGFKRTDIEYPKIAGKNNKNCTYCPFATMIGKDGNVVCDKGKVKKTKK